MVAFGIAARILSIAAPAVSKAVQKVAPAIIPAASKVLSAAKNLISSPAPVKTVASVAQKTAAAIVPLAIGAKIAGVSDSTTKKAVGTTIAFGGGLGTGAFVASQVLTNNVKAALGKPATQEVVSFPSLPVQSQPVFSSAALLPQVNKELNTNVPAPLPSEEKEPTILSAIEREVKEIAGKKVSENVSVGDVGKVAAGIALVAGGAMAADKVYKSKTKSKRKAKVSSSKVSAKRPTTKRKSGVRPKKYGSSGGKLKFGSPAWQKKYGVGKYAKKGKTSKPAKSKRKVKGSGSYYEIEQAWRGDKVQHGMKTEKVGTEAQYKAKGGKDVKYDKRGRPYIVLKSGMHRFIKKSEA